MRSAHVNVVYRAVRRWSLDRYAVHPWHPSSTPLRTSRNAVALVFQSGEIYGGTKSAWDYGPLGVELKENIKRQWWRSVVTGRDDVVGLDSAIILPRQVWVASGHVGGVQRPARRMPELPQAPPAGPPAGGVRPEEGRRTRRRPDGRDRLPDCGTKGQWTEPRDFNMMLKTYLGPIESEERPALPAPARPRRASSSTSPTWSTTARRKPPFGIGQIGKSFRNEITPATSSSAPASSSRWRWSSSSSPSTAPEWHQVLDRDPAEVVHRPRYRPGEPAPLRASQGEAVALQRPAPPISSTSSASPATRGVSWRVSPTAPTSTCPRHAKAFRCGPVVLRPGHRLAIRAVRHRARRRPDPVADGLPGRRVPRGRGPERQGRRGQAHRAAARPAAGPGQGGGAAVVAQRGPVSEGARPGGRAAPVLEHRLRRRGRDRPALPPPGRDRHPVLHHRGLRFARRPGRHHPGARHR